jgi:branched-chain amino acid transport system permease protein
VSFTVLAMVILGGIGNIWGVAAGAFIVFLIQVVFLKQINTVVEAFHIPVLSDINFLNYQFLLYGIALVLMMLYRPEGLFPSRTRKAELLAEAADVEAEEAAEVQGSLGAVPGSEQ